MSRAFGDRLLKRFVVADPDILEAELGAEDRVLILATDGLWDVITNEEAIALIRVRRGLPDTVSVRVLGNRAPYSFTAL